MLLQRPRGLTGRRDLRFLGAGLASAVLLVGVLAPAVAAAPMHSAATRLPGVKSAQINGVHKITSTARFAAPYAVRVTPPTANELKPPEDEGESPYGHFQEGRSAFLTMPVVQSYPVTADRGISGNPGTTGWDAISGTESRYASPDGTRWNWNTEPPDQALCVGNGYVVEGVNGAVEVRNTQGASLTGVTPTNYFFGFPAEYPDGPSIGDPRCLYDPATRRFFFTSYLQFTDQVTFGTLLAVSNSSDPTGSWTVWQIPDLGGGGYTTGPGVLDGCVYACFPDYPQTGLDANAFWITNNEFDFGDPYDTPYAGVTIIGVSKAALISGGLWGEVWGLGYDQMGDPYGFSLEPAAAPAGAYDRAAGGTEYFMATRAFDGTVDNVIDVWSISNTSALNGSGLAGDPQRAQLTGQTYACGCVDTEPANGAPQPNGPHPLGQANGLPISRLDTNDSRMHNVVYANGMLWGAASSVMNVRSGTIGQTTGIAWWGVQLYGQTLPGRLTATIRGQGLIGAQDTYLWFPSIAVSGSNVVIAADISGPTRFPSVAYVPLSLTAGPSVIRVAAAGLYPADGFTQLPQYARNGTERWGDYTAATVDEQGRVWFAGEWIGPKGAPNVRAVNVNWGTWVGWIRPTTQPTPAPTQPPTAPN